MSAAPTPRDQAGASAPFRLLDDFQAQYIKYQGREPRTLAELAIALADNEYKRRLAEVKAMSARLAMFDPFMPALAARGIKVWPSQIHSHDSGKVLRIYTGMFERTSDKLHAALLELGFHEFEYKEHPTYNTVKLRHGRWLLVEIDVSKKPAAPAAEPQPAAPAAPTEERA